MWEEFSSALTAGFMFGVVSAAVSTLFMYTFMEKTPVNFGSIIAVAIITFIVGATLARIFAGGHGGLLFIFALTAAGNAAFYTLPAMQAVVSITEEK